MYQQDSFFDLSPLGQLGLAGISCALFALFLLLTWATLRRRSVLLRIPCALLLFYIFVWISPQVYFQYYHLIFDSLPTQWVIFPPPSPLKALEFMTLQGPENLSAHSQGLLGWCMLIAPNLWRGQGH